MALSKEESDNIKQHLMQQLGRIPENQQAEVKKRLEEMPPEQVEQMIKQDELTHLGGQCIFCSITHGKVPSVRIAENAENIAILELNPLSKGHTLVLPRDHLDKPLPSTNDLINEVSSMLKILNPKKIHINETKIMGHPIVEVIPLFGDEKERRKATPEDLERVKAELMVKPKVEVQPEPVKVETLDPAKPLYKLPPRIP
jgi:hypothetical protein